MRNDIDIRLMHTPGCHSWKDALKVLEEAMAEVGIKSTISVNIIETDEDAVQFKFVGSPTIQINGEDVDASSKRVTQYKAASCRLYFYEGRSYDYPPKEMIINALLRHIR
ncbi:MAG TPA: DF family (seleno)protein [Candidatus Brocadiia bacterium]